MVDHITKFHRSSRGKYKFCVLIPSWNNLEFLRICVESILRNSHFDIQIIVIVNEGRDETITWIENKKEIDFIHAAQNIGICYGLNITRSMIKSDYVVYINDDMYMLPKWDLALMSEIEQIGHSKFMLSGTLIEPIDTGNPCVIVCDYGRDAQSFDEEKLLKTYETLLIKDWSGSTWPPNVVHIDNWDLVGGMSIEYSPGMYSDPDLSRKLFQIGVRVFKGKGNCLAYHFGSKSTKRVKRNNGRKTFLLKWGISANTFSKDYLKLGQPYGGEVSEPKAGKLKSIYQRLKRMKSGW